MEKGDMSTDDPVVSEVIRMRASAGSGKTHALALRYLKILLSDGTGRSELPGLLAVTFTNKAASEMQSRILSWLKALAFRDEIYGVSGWLRRKLGLGVEELGRRAEEKLEEIFNDFRSFQVKTIDSFLVGLAHGAALEVGLPPGGEPVVDTKPVAEQALRELLDEAERNAVLADNFDRIVQRILTVRQELGWDVGEEFLKIGEALRALRARTGKAFKPVSPDLNGLSAIQEGAVADAKELAELFTGGTLKTISRKPALASELVDFCERGNLALLKSNYFSKEALEAVVASEYRRAVTPEMKELWRGFRRKLSAYAIAGATVSSLSFLEVFDRVEGTITRRLREENRFLLESLPFIFKDFLGGGGVPAAYFYWGERIRHFLLDEFQDTNLVQWETLRPLVVEALSVGGSLFIVGDVKQAVYGFRGGDSRLFGEITGELRVEPIDDSLNTNRRSRKVLVDFFREVFSEKKLGEWAKWALLDKNGRKKKDDVGKLIEENLDSIVEEFRDADQKAVREGGFVRVESIAVTGKEDGKELNTDEAKAWLVRKASTEIVENLLEREYGYGDIAFLVRTNREASICSRILLEEGKPVVSEATLSLDSCQPVRELVGFLTFLDSPVDDLSFANFIGGAVFNGATGFSRECFHGLIEEKSNNREKALYLRFKKEYEEVWRKWIEPSFRSVGYQTPYDLVQDLLARFDLRKRFHAFEAFFYHLLECLKTLEDDGKTSLGDFIAFYGNRNNADKLMVPLHDKPGAIRVLTVHKAKGLGFPVVILPFPYMEVKSRRWTMLETAETKIPVSITKKLARWNDQLHEKDIEGLKEGLFEELHLFYVSLTRAMDELYVYLPSRKLESQRLLKGKKQVPINIPEEAPLVLGNKTQMSQSAVGTPKEHPPKQRSPGWKWVKHLEISKREGGPLSSTEVRLASRRGTLVHLALQAGATSKEETAAALECEGATPQEVEEIALLLKRMAKEPSIRPFMEAFDRTKVRNELSILDEEGRLHVVDRLLYGSEGLTIIDWKTGDPETKKHSAQLLGYCRLLTRIYPGRPIKAFLVYVDKLEVKEVPWPG